MGNTPGTSPRAFTSSQCSTFDKLDTEECDNGCEQGNTLDKSSGHNHVREQFVHYFRLTSHSIHGLTANLTNTDTCANSCETCAYCGTQLCNTFCCQ